MSWLNADDILAENQRNASFSMLDNYATWFGQKTIFRSGNINELIKEIPTFERFLHKKGENKYLRHDSKKSTRKKWSSYTNRYCFKAILTYSKS